jgi:glycosyltransferase involved in cell wall biosynthesis
MTRRPLVSAVLIVRDEAGLLEECLQSLRSFADEVVVVDTGSTDGSIKRAEDAGARVAECPWTDDFAAARNFALDLALGEWVLYIDADERLRPRNQAAARHLLSEGGVGFTVDLHPRKGWTAYREYRLWRNKPSIRFRGVIHETVLDSLRAAAGGALDNIPRSGLVIDHVGYEGSLVEKFRRNLPLLQQALADDPERVFLWHDYGCALAGLGRHVEAERAWGEAIVRSRSSEPSHPPAGHVLSYLSLIARRRDLGQQYHELLDEALARFPDDWALAWWEGRRLLDGGRYEEAAATFEKLVATTPESLDGTEVAYPVELFGTWALEGLALALFRLGRSLEAGACFEQLACSASEPDRYKQMAVISRNQGGSPRGSIGG